MVKRMSAKSPSARRRRMCASVSAYAAAGAAPTTSSPNSSASRSSSAAVMAPFCPGLSFSPCPMPGTRLGRSCQDNVVKAVRIHEDGGPEVLRYEDAPDPEAGPDDVPIELRAASLNHLDVWIRKGLPSVPKPRILGADGAGVIAGTDERVVINPAITSGGKTHIVGETMNGTHAELIALPRPFVHPIPGDLS